MLWRSHLKHKTLRNGALPADAARPEHNEQGGGTKGVRRRSPVVQLFRTFHQQAAVRQQMELTLNRFPVQGKGQRRGAEAGGVRQNHTLRGDKRAGQSWGGEPACPRK